MAHTRSLKPAYHVVVETSPFIADADKAGLGRQQRADIVLTVARDPQQGDVIKGSGGVRKIRVAGRGKGKSGGYRIVAAYFAENMPVYLLALLSKGDRGNFTDTEIKAFKQLTTEIVRAVRERRKK